MSILGLLPPLFLVYPVPKRIADLVVLPVEEKNRERNQQIAGVNINELIACFLELGMEEVTSIVHSNTLTLQHSHTQTLKQTL